MKTPLVFLCASLLVIAGCATKARETVAASADGVTVRDFKLVGDLNKERAAFTLSAVVTVNDAKGGSID